MASRPWSDSEIALLERHAEANNWQAVLRYVPDRTVNAVKVRMTKLRRELGFEDARGAKDAQELYNADAVIASQKLAEATLRVGRWS